MMAPDGHDVLGRDALGEVEVVVGATVALGAAEFAFTLALAGVFVADLLRSAVSVAATSCKNVRYSSMKCN